MKEFIEEALAKPENRFRIPLSRDRTYVPFFAPPRVQSNTKDGKLISSEVGSTIIGSARGMRFFRIRTETGRELIADGQRALYTVPPGRSRLAASSFAWIAFELARKSSVQTTRERKRGSKRSASLKKSSDLAIGSGHNQRL